MSPMTLPETAAAELQAAADLADQHADGNPLDPWSALAGIIRLVASGLDPFGDSETVEEADLQAHLTTALGALDRLSTQEAPSDIEFWRAHVHDLIRDARTLQARASSGLSGRR